LLRNVPGNAEVVSGAYAAFAVGDHRGACEAFAPEVEWVPPRHGSTAGVYSGRGGVYGWFKLLADVYSDIRAEISEVVEVGADRVIAFVQVKATARASGLELDEQWAHVWTMRGGRATRVELFTSRREALEAVAASKDAFPDPTSEPHRSANGLRPARPAPALGLA
jgi:ketosteroid isomerase-like protein